MMKAKLSRSLSTCAGPGLMALVLVAFPEHGLESSCGDQLSCVSTPGAALDLLAERRDTPPDALSTRVAAAAGKTTRISVSSTGAQGNGDRIDGGSLDSRDAAISSNGRFVAFTSAASNLVANDTNGDSDIFVRDRDADKDGIFDESCFGNLCTNPAPVSTRRVSVSSSGAQANSISGFPAVSPSGRFVAFTSEASNLVANDTNGRDDIFVRDRDTDTDGIFDEPGAVATRRVSLSSGGSEANNHSQDPAISSSGRFVVFSSVASNLVANDTNELADDIFVRDRDSDNDGIFDETHLGAVSTRRVSVSSSGGQGNDWSSRPAISSSGRFVAFTSEASNLVYDTNQWADIFVRDRDSDNDGIFDETHLGAVSTRRVSVSSNGAQGNDRSNRPAISSSGRFVAFQSAASNLVANDTNLGKDIFVRDRDTDKDGIFDEPGAVSTRRVSLSSSGAQAGSNGLNSENPTISFGGRFVAFLSSTSNLVANDTNGSSDIFLRDRDTDTDGVFDEPGAVSTQLVSLSSSGAQGNDRSFGTPAIDTRGRFVAFPSFASNLVANDTNNALDVFVRDLMP